MAISTANSLCICTLKFASLSKPRTLSRNPNCLFRVRSKSSPRDNIKTTTSPEDESSYHQEELFRPLISDEKVERSQPVSPSVSYSFSSLIGRLSNVFKVDELARDVLAIALPAALALAADPITSLVDTAFVGHLGSVELAAVGVSVSVFNLVSKLFNVPLLNITTSFVAEERTFSTNKTDGQEGQHQGKKFLPSVSTSLVLAAVIGIAEAVALTVGTGFIMNFMGIPSNSPMRAPTEHFLSVRAFGAPPIVIALAAQGAFRGFKDTKTPSYAIGAGNLLNAILDPVLIFLFDFGIGGAAAATVLSEYLIACILLSKLNGEVALLAPNIDMRRVASYLKSGGLLIGRTVAVLIPMTLATSLAAQQGPVPMAGHQICIEVWLAVSLLTDALAIAGQTLLATSYTEGNYKQARLVIFRILEIGLVTGIGFSALLFLGFGTLCSLLTTDSEVLKIAWSGTLFVAGSQPVNAIAFVLDGLYYGVSDFRYAAYSTVLVGLVSSLFLLGAASKFSLAGIWAGLFLFMILRLLAGVWRLGTKGGPWKLIWCSLEDSE